MKIMDGKTFLNNGSNFEEKSELKKVINFELLKVISDEELVENITELVFNKIKSKEIISLEDIQETIIETLLEQKLYKKARKYLYLVEHEHMANHSYFVDSIKLVDDYLSKLDWRVFENSNMSYSMQGLNFFVSSEITKNYWLHKIYPEYIRRAYLDGDIHIHDLGLLSAYCCGWDLYGFLAQGFGGCPTKIESKPPKHFRSALGQIVNFMYTIQGETAGATAFSHFDTLLAPFIYYDNLSYDQVKQALQEFVFNMNVPTRVGFQVPFSNITLDIYNSPYDDQNVIIGGIPQKETYSDFEEERQILVKALFEVMMEGDAKGRVFTFPIPTINITKDFPFESEYLYSLWEATARYGLPYFANFISSDMNPNDIFSMCCRLRMNVKELNIRKGGLFASNPLTGSIGVVTINMPRIGYLAKDDAEYFDLLYEKMVIAKDSLEIKRKYVEYYTELGLYPYCKHYLKGIKAKTGQYWANHFSTIGLIGMNESLLNFMGVSIVDKEGHKFAQKVLDFMLKVCEEFTDETGNLYNLEATPGEGCSHRLALIDKRKYPNIIVANEEDVRTRNAAPYYTNSTHPPVDAFDDIFDLLDHQNDLQTKYTGGTVVHIWMGEHKLEPTVIPKLIKKIFNNYQIPYISFTPTFSICPNHGYIYGEHFECPYCGAECEVYSRIVGYIRAVQNWNPGKKEEFKNRKYYDKSLMRRL
jgi:ribonucleoside-triphosphate reductase